MTDPLFTHLYGSVPEDAAPKTPGLTPTITLPVAEYDAALAQARADGMRAAVQVKPLVWHDCSDGTAHDDNRWYEIDRQGASNFSFRLVRGVTGGGAYLSHHLSMDAAKAAAQTDYAARTIAALSPAPAVPADAGLDDAADRLGAWLSAALDDPNVCDAMKADIQAWFAALGVRQTPAPQVPPEVLRQVVEAGNRLLPYLAWTIGPESPGHHPTMPSAVAQFSAALAAIQPHIGEGGA